MSKSDINSYHVGLIARITEKGSVLICTGQVSIEVFRILKPWRWSTGSIIDSLTRGPGFNSSNHSLVTRTYNSYILSEPSLTFESLELSSSPQSCITFGFKFQGPSWECSLFKNSPEECSFRWHVGTQRWAGQGCGCRPTKRPSGSPEPGGWCGQQ